VGTSSCKDPVYTFTTKLAQPEVSGRPVFCSARNLVHSLSSVIPVIPSIGFPLTGPITYVFLLLRFGSLRISSPFGHLHNSSSFSNLFWHYLMLLLLFVPSYINCLASMRSFGLPSLQLIVSFVFNCFQSNQPALA
jgi:hypothetical protein